jgi:hypothetical protein
VTAEQIAKVCHEVNRAYCRAIGDDSQPAWEDAPDWQRNSATDGVTKHIERPRTPEESHELWLADKHADGWKYGPTKDPAAKLHPCFVPYAELPQEQRVKDYLFGAVVASLKEAL